MASKAAMLQSVSHRSVAHASRPAAVSQRPFSGRCAPLKVNRPQRRRASLCAQAFQSQWPDPEFVKEVTEAFPDQGVANVEEARVLYETGWTYLDVRSQLEVQEVGARVKNSVNIPFVNATRKYDPEQQKKVLLREPNEGFIDAVKKRFPDPETAKLLVACSDGRKYSMDALEALDEAGYYNLAGLKGGYYAWFRVFDAKMNRRVSGEYAETYTHDGDSAGVHASGAGFDRVDPADKWQPPDW